MSENNITQFVNDEEFVKQLKDEVVEAYQPLIAILNKAKKRNFIVQSSVSETPFGGFIVQGVQVLKTFG